MIMVLLAGIIVISQKTGDYLYGSVEQKNNEQEDEESDIEENVEENEKGNAENNKEVSEETDTKEGLPENDADAEETAAETSEPVIVVDAGHGGSDPGKIGINDAQEKDVNLIIAVKLQKMLKEKGIKVIMTREDENGLADSKVEDLKARVAVINKNSPDLAVCIHQNSYSDERIHGAQVFYYTHSAEGEKAALIMQEALLEIDPENSREAKANTTYYMLKTTKPPVLIVECGFLSNREEAEKLVTDEYQEQVAEAVTKGILEYLESKSGNQPSF